jgi:pSer/pThr/pTyr-binding forkhead associated (FHA) protein
MSESPLARHIATPAELKDRNEADRAGEPYLVLRDGGGQQLLVPLESGGRMTIGRREQNDVALTWDERASRLHAELEHVGGEWVLVDDGLSTHGTWVGETRLVGRRRLRDGDLIRVGQTLIAFCAPGETRRGTAYAEGGESAVRVSPAQRRVLVALCRPLLAGGAYTTPPTNAQLAEELFLAVDSIKTHMKALYEAFGLETEPQGKRRAMLVDRAVRLGVVTDRDLA